MTGQPNLRGEVVAALTAGLPAGEWVIVGYADAPTRIEKRTAVVWAATIEPSARLKKGQYALQLQVEVATPHQDVAKADDDLDGAVLDVLDVLLAMPSISFERAERMTNDAKTAHGWAITVQQILTATPDTPED